LSRVACFLSASRRPVPPPRPLPPCSPPSPYTTLFRSGNAPAPGCTARIGWPRTRCSRVPCSGPAQRTRLPPTRLPLASAAAASRSEEHTSELQSRFDLVCRLLLEKKNLHNFCYIHWA